MIVDHARKLVFIATPRTSSLSTANWLRDRFGGENLRGYHAIPSAEELPEYSRWTTVRNPYTRAQSVYAWAMKQHHDQYQDLPKMSWLDFLLWLAEESEDYRHPNAVMFVPQHRFLADVKLARIFRFERVPRCFAKWSWVSAEDLRAFPWNNRGTSVKPKICFRAAELIRQWARADFRAFGYESKQIPK